jgi:hypothetical protein
MCDVMSIGTASCTEDREWRYGRRLRYLLALRTFNTMLRLCNGRWHTGSCLIGSGGSLRTAIWDIRGKIYRDTLLVLSLASGDVQLSLQVRVTPMILTRTRSGRTRFALCQKVPLRVIRADEGCGWLRAVERLHTPAELLVGRKVQIGCSGTIVYLATEGVRRVFRWDCAAVMVRFLLHFSNVFVETRQPMILGFWGSCGFRTVLNSRHAKIWEACPRDTTCGVSLVRLFRLFGFGSSHRGILSH